MLHSDYSDYALLYNSLIALPKSDCFQVKPNKLQKSAGVAHMLKMQHHNLLIFIFSMMTQLFMRIMKDGGHVIEQSEFMLSPAQSGWLFESAVVCMHKCLNYSL